MHDPTKAAVEAFAALAHDTRLAAFRLLVQAGPSGLNAGEIAQRLGVPASTLSHHLAILERAALLRSWRVQRQIFYASDYDGTRRLIAFLMEDCCQGRPDLCGTAIDDLTTCAPTSECATPTATEKAPR
ncbi:ArsR/SmtB family transcription factor [Azospirillum griseum]|uniref:Transcriptional regulator n=1 Tax=Azospirillum griseum TaxID=2496639 RepID=A0A431VCR5_9PROT|nr:helix-turn-helix transcriptional regulator [Azospirillum griseum]RTR16771.1 transcriptional regulator [Azospirillum griseum]